MFDFVSPFDVFEKPKPKTARNLSESPKPASNPNVAAQPVTAATSRDAEVKSNPVSTLHHIGSPAPSQATQRKASGPASLIENINKDLGLPWTLNKIVEKGIEGRG